MRKLQLYLQQQKVYEADSRDVAKWPKYYLPNNEKIVEDTAHRIFNPELTKDQSLELTLASKSPTISDSYRFDCEGSHSFDMFQEMMYQYQITEPVILYRGVSEVPFRRMIESAEELNEKGVDFYEKGFMSCSLMAEKASPYPVQLIIFCMPFQHMLYVGHALDEQEATGCRYEVILQRGAKLQVILQIGDTYYCRLLGTL